MSFHALALAAQAVDVLPELEDDEFGLTWADLGTSPELTITWALYRSEGAGLVFGVLHVDPQPIGAWLDQL